MKKRDDIYRQVELFETFFPGNVSHFRDLCSQLKIGQNGVGPVLLFKESFYSLVKWRSVDVVKEAFKYSPHYEADVVMQALLHPFPGVFGMLPLIAELCFNVVTPETIETMLSQTESYLKMAGHDVLNEDGVDFSDQIMMRKSRYDEKLPPCLVSLSIDHRTITQDFYYPRLLHACLTQITKKLHDGAIINCY